MRIKTSLDLARRLPNTPASKTKQTGSANAITSLVPEAEAIAGMGAVVVSVTVAMVLASMEVGFTEHTGASCGLGVTEHVSETEPENQFMASALAVVVADCPALTGSRDKPDNTIVKSGT